jgi:ecdysteroid 25-hydroxylase CYP302A1
VNIVWLFDPNDIQTMFSKEGSCPSRRSHLALEKYRVDRPHLYNNGGLLPTNGPEWARLRLESQKPLALQSSLGKNLIKTSVQLYCSEKNKHVQYQF